MNIKRPYIQGQGPEVVEAPATDVQENTNPAFPPVTVNTPSLTALVRSHFWNCWGAGL